MTITAVLLLLVASATHASWNLVGKRTHPSAAFFLLSVAFEVLWLAPLAVWHRAEVALIPAEVWLRMVAAGACMAVYFVTLGGAYRHGHMSVAYPLARGLPVVGVALLTHLAGWGAPLAASSVAGMALVLAGCFLLPMRRFGELRLRNYLNLSCVLAVGTGAATVGYTLIDSAALAVLRSAEGPGLSPLTAAMVYVPFELTATGLWLGICVLVAGRSRRALRELLPVKWRQAALAGLCMAASYVLILTAMGHVDNVSYVIAFLQLSILLGAVASVALLGEPAGAAKFAGVAVMVGGLVLVALRPW